jgi:GNAT superfamily N-acetyltransferase
MNRAVKIDKVNRDNMKDFLLLIDGFAHYENAAPPDDAARRRLEIDALSKNPPFQGFVAYLGDRPVGYIIYYFTYSTYDGERILFLEDIFVAEDARKMGVGRELFNFSLGEAKKQGCCELQWAVFARNEDAIAFYGRMGGKREDFHIYCIEEKDFGGN